MRKCANMFSVLLISAALIFSLCASADGITFFNAEYNGITFMAAIEDDELDIIGFVGEDMPETVVFPSEIDGIPVRYIQNVQLDGSLTEQYIPFDLQGIKEMIVSDGIQLFSEFTGTENLETVVLPESVQHIPSYGFAGASNLKNINLENVKRVLSYSFYKCTSLKEVNLSSAESISDTAFEEVTDLIIYGYPGSAAEDFAVKHGYEFREVLTEEQEQSITEMAKKLQILGLLKGTGTDDETGETVFELNRSATRAEALVMLIRLLGCEQQALSSEKTHPFTDVPEWADGYVSYAYENGLTKGVSENAFDPDAEVSAASFLTFVLRALQYEDCAETPDFAWDSPWDLAQECGIIKSDNNRNFLLRGHMVEISYNALFAKIKGTETKLYEKMISSGVISKQLWNETQNDSQIGGGDYTFSRKFRDEVYNIYLATQIVGEEASEQWVNDYLAKPPEEQEGLPPIYQIIRDLNITREQFEAENEKYIGFGNYFSQDIIDALYCGNEEEMKILLANPYALVYDGEIYTFNELSNTPATCSAQSIPADVMEEYLDYIESVLENAGILKYEQERIDNLREYCETGE